MTAYAPTPAATVLIPAWNEEAVIARTLAGLAPARNRLRVIVIANACTDGTADAARRAAPWATVLETPVAGKAAALNLGLRHAVKDKPIVLLDADLRVTGAAIGDLIAPLAAGQALATCGEMDLATHEASAPVRAWARAWALNPYFARGKFGGLIALAPAAVSLVFPLPRVIADDEFIRRSLGPDRIVRVPACRFLAEAPRSLGSLVRVRRRVMRGNRALQLGRPAGEGARAMLRAALDQPDRWPDLAVFALVALWVRLSLAFERSTAALHWDRDDDARTRGQPASG